MPRTRPLDPVEIRVLGALLEKEQATPDQYPLTTRAVIAASNQKTNREPVTDLTETEVTEALDRLRADVLVWRSQTARTEKWEHRLGRRWELDPRAKAVMTLLLLRGPQTPGELRSRGERLHAFDSVAEVEAILERLAAGPDPLVRELPRQPGQRETRWMHRVGRPEDEAPQAEAREAEPPRARTAATSGPAPSPPPSARELVKRLGLAPHPEGGFFREVYRSGLEVLHPAAPGNPDRPAGTHIYFLLRADQASAFHRVRWSDEIWHLYAGDALELQLIHEDGRHERRLLTADLGAGAPCTVVPAGCWQAARLAPADAPGHGWALGGCTVTPGFDFEDFDLPSAEELLRLHPEHGELIRALGKH
ncbi:MAG: DUF480 domain-containing protein [Thermoanaerobaculia bacterium]